MKNALLIIEVIVSIILIALILLQAGDAGGLAGVWQGGGETYSSKRGVEKIVFGATITTAVSFGLLAIIIIAL